MEELIDPHRNSDIRAPQTTQGVPPPFPYLTLPGTSREPGKIHTLSRLIASYKTGIVPEERRGINSVCNFYYSVKNPINNIK